MFIKLLSLEIPKYWETIKAAAATVNQIPEKDLPLYLNRLLHALLNDKAQCFVRVTGTGDKRRIIAVLLTRIVGDEITGEKSLFIECLYSYKVVSDERWIREMDIVKKFAEKANCKRITFYTRNERMFEIAQLLGFKERFRCFEIPMNVNGGEA